jgi:hypothetical protein
MEPGRNSGVYPAGLVVEDFLPLALAVNETVVVTLPALFTVEEARAGSLADRPRGNPKRQ